MFVKSGKGCTAEKPGPGLKGNKRKNKKRKNEENSEEPEPGTLSLKVSETKGILGKLPKKKVK